MSKKEFDNITGKPLDQMPYKPKPIPESLKETDKLASEKVKFNFSDYMRFLWLYLLKEGEGLLPQERIKAEKVSSWVTIIGFIIVGIFLLYCAWR